MAKLIQIDLGLVNYKIRDESYETINFSCKLDKSNTSVRIKHDIFP